MARARRDYAESSSDIDLTPMLEGFSVSPNPVSATARVSGQGGAGG